MIFDGGLLFWATLYVKHTQSVLCICDTQCATWRQEKV